MVFGATTDTVSKSNLTTLLSIDLYMQLSNNVTQIISIMNKA